MQQVLECAYTTFVLVSPTFEQVYHQLRPLLHCRRRVHLTLRHVGGQLNPRRLPKHQSEHALHHWRLYRLLLPVAPILKVAQPKDELATAAAVQSLLNELEAAETSEAYAQADLPADMDVEACDRLLLAMRREQLALLPNDFQIALDSPHSGVRAAGLTETPTGS